MRYHSTRNRDLQATDMRAIIDGLAQDGGLFVPAAIPEFDWQACLQLSSMEISAKLLAAFFPNLPQMEALVERAYAGKFESDVLTPTVSVGDFAVLELFRGPTSAFKDVALSVLPQLLVAAKQEAGETSRTLVLTATSGDTGKAAMEGFADVPGTEICVFYPDGGVSQIQRAQMVTQTGKNVHVYGIKGNFDDAQTGVKQIFADVRDGVNAVNADHGASDGNAGTNVKAAAGMQAVSSTQAATADNYALRECKLSSANSINIGRLIPQIMYYFAAYRDLLQAGRIELGERVDFSVPTGNFGDILAGYLAKRLGLPVGKLLCASNANNVLTDFFRTGVYDRRRELKKTISPSMDILVSSNLERMLYFLCEDPAQVQAWMNDLRQMGYYQLSAQQLSELHEHFWAGYCDDRQAGETIRQVWERDGYLCDPHTAAGWKVAQDYWQELAANDAVADVQTEQGAQRKRVMVVLATAAPYKFPRAVLEALGQIPQGDDFALLDQLHEYTNVPVPQNLARLQECTELHPAVIQTAQMRAAAFGELSCRQCK